jgi:hypothetical protein
MIAHILHNTPLDYLLAFATFVLWLLAIEAKARHRTP